MPSEETSSTNSTKSTKSAKTTDAIIPGLPGWVGVLAVIVVVAVIALSIVPKTDAPASNGYVPPSNVPAANNPPAIPTNSSSIFKIVVSPSSPKAGNDVMFTATLDPAYATAGWQQNFWYEIWVRQFGNWKIKSCYDSPCSITWESASQGNLEYLIKRYPSTGDVITEPASGSYLLSVESTVKLNDTVGPKLTLFYTPGHPSANYPVSITASADDLSGMEKVDVFVDGELKRSCPQKVKIIQCLVSVSGLEAGDHTYSATAIDSLGNTTSTGDKALFVYSK